MSPRLRWGRKLPPRGGGETRQAPVETAAPSGLPPCATAFAALNAAGQESLRNELVNLWSTHNQAADGTTKVDAEYLEVIATRGRN